jgi:hypothetical protein
MRWSKPCYEIVAARWHKIQVAGGNGTVDDGKNTDEHQ